MLGKWRATQEGSPSTRFIDVELLRQGFHEHRILKPILRHVRHALEILVETALLEDGHHFAAVRTFGCVPHPGRDGDRITRSSQYGLIIKNELDLAASKQLA